MRVRFSVITILLVLASCRERPETPAPLSRQAASVVAGLDVAGELEVTELSREILEISGIAVIDSTTLVAIEDEHGILYVLDAADGTIRERHRFGDEGDYEGIARDGETVYVLRSDGVLFEVRSWRSQDRVVTRLDTELGDRCDAEGLSHDEPAGRLLIACKEPVRDRAMRDIFAFDLKTRRLQTDPIYRIAIDDVAPYVSVAAQETLRDKFAVFVRQGAGSFKPSAIGRDPGTGRLFVLSAELPMIVVLDGEGRFQTAVWLPEKLFAQPEGLTFLPDGTLLIANEGVTRGPTFVRLPYRSGHAS